MQLLAPRTAAPLDQQVAAMPNLIAHLGQQEADLALLYAAGVGMFAGAADF